MSELAISDRLCLQEIFPHELWRLVVLKIINIETYYKIIRASPYFENLLQPQRSKIIYACGIQILLKHWNVKTTPQNLDCVLVCRKICAFWKSIVDAFLQDEAHHHLRFPTDSNPFYDIRNFSKRGCEELQTIDDIQDFADQFRESHVGTPGNPFLFRSVSVTIEAETEFLGSFINLLTDYGHHVWYLRIEIRKNSSGRDVKLIANLQQILKLLPNLSALKISYSIATFFENNLAVRKFLQNHPMPALKHLTILETSSVPTSVVESLLDANSRTISKLSIRSGIKLANFARFPNLKTLFLPFLTQRDYQIFEAQAAHLRIAKLHLDLKGLRFTSVPIERAFKLLETFSETLEELSLALPCSTKCKIPNSLLLPKLQKIDLLLSDYASLDFLLPMCNTIKCFCVDVSNVDGNHFNEQNNRIKFYSCQGELQHSNIWTLFPNLLIAKCRRPTHHYFGKEKWIDVVTRASL